MDDAMREGREWVMVPREPTDAMLDAYWSQTGESREMRARTYAYMRRYWSAMLAAAPAQPSQAGFSDREAIARIVGPKAWVQRQRHLEQAEACEYPDHADQWIVRADDVVRPSLDIADAILASIRPSVGEWEALRVGKAIEAAWNGSGSKGQRNNLPPIDLTDHEREHLGSAALTAICGGSHADAS